MLIREAKTKLHTAKFPCHGKEKGCYLVAPACQEKGKKATPHLTLAGRARELPTWRWERCIYPAEGCMLSWAFPPIRSSDGLPAKLVNAAPLRQAQA